MANFMTEKQRWFKYEVPAGPGNVVARTGSFDMLEVFWTEGTKRVDGPWSWALRLRSAPTVPLILDDANFQKFARALDDYWIARERL